MKNLSVKMWNVVDELCSQLAEQLSTKEDCLVLTDDEDKDAIWGYVFLGDGLFEQQVKAIQVCDGKIYVLIDDYRIKYTRKDALRENEYWYSLKLGELLTVQTAYNIAENINQYL